MLPKQQVAYLAQKSELIIKAILEKGDFNAEISKEIITEVTRFFLRDIYRIDEQQRGKISLAKFAGYWGFWIRKLKPISLASPRSGEHKTEKQEINEVVAVLFACELVNLLRATGSFSDFVWTACDQDTQLRCNGSDCFNAYLDRFATANDKFFINYVQYSMRHRTFGPHHFVLFLEQLLFSACVKSQFTEEERRKLLVE